MVNAILLGNEIKMPYNIDAAALLGLGNELGQHRIIGARERQNVAVKAWSSICRKWSAEPSNA